MCHDNEKCPSGQPIPVTIIFGAADITVADKIMFEKYTNHYNGLLL
jgi:hypothetical protein